MIDQLDVEAARERDGSAGSRSEEVEELLVWEQVGKHIGSPLAAEDYSQYPDSREEMSAPGWGPFLRSLCGHPLITEWSDAVKELGGDADSYTRRKWRDALQNATEAAGIDSDQLLGEGDPSDCGGPDAALSALTDDLSDHIVSEDNLLCLAYLYAQRGLSTDELADLFDTEESGIRRRLHDVGLVPTREDNPQGKTAEDLLLESGGEVSENDLKLGGVNVNAVRDDKNVTVEQANE